MFKSIYPRRTFLKASGISLSARALLGSNSAAPLRRIENGFVSSAGVAKDGWYAGILVLDDRESEFCKGLPDPGRWACAVTGNGFEAEFKKAAQWRAAIDNSPRRLFFHSERLPADGRMLTAAERICGPVAARGTTAKPALVWTERREGRWTLRTFDGGRISSVYSAAGILRNPAVAITAGGIVLACECEGKNGPEIRLLSEQGIVTTVAGVNPRLAAGRNTLFLLFERAMRDTISVALLEFDGSRVLRDVEVPSVDDYTKNADLLCDASDGSVLVAAESCPAFGISEQLGTYRAVHLWSLPPGKSTFVPWPKEGRNQAPVPPDSVPLFPRLFRIAGAPAVAYRIYRYSEMKGTYGWDVWISRLEHGEWSTARMVTSDYGAADTGFDILDVRGKQIGVFPCRDHFPGGHISRRYWTEIVDLSAKRRAEVKPAPAVPNVKPASGLCAIALDPPELPSHPEGLELIWGDLHHHTAYSTCQAPTNGMPQDHLRFSRDVLGCQILTLTEHGHHMIEPESTYVQDRVEEFAGQKGIVLYADEPNPEPGRHTIFYTIDRRIFDRLRTIFLSHGRSRPEVYRHIHRALPPRSVIAITHFHGHPLRGDAMRAAFDPELDVAMESMQIRGNVMMQLHRESEGLLFPNDCLNLGLKVGLVAGTDHTFAADVRRNHYCLTGLWVRERTPEGVFDAIRARRTVGMSDGKIAVWATLAGQGMGSEVECSGKVSIHAELSCARRIVRAALMCDGKIRNWTPIGGKRASLELVDPEPAPGYHWYVVTAEMETAYGTPGYCHASPFFVTVRA